MTVGWGKQQNSSGKFLACVNFILPQHPTKHLTVAPNHSTNRTCMAYWQQFRTIRSKQVRRKELLLIATFPNHWKRYTKRWLGKICVPWAGNWRIQGLTAPALENKGNFLQPKHRYIWSGLSASKDPIALQRNTT